METKTIHIEMDCIHDHGNGTMTCSWLNGEIKIVVDWNAAQLGVMNGSKVVEVRDIQGMSIEEFMHLQYSAKQPLPVSRCLTPWLYD